MTAANVNAISLMRTIVTFVQVKLRLELLDAVSPHNLWPIERILARFLDVLEVASGRLESGVKKQA